MAYSNSQRAVRFLYHRPGGQGVGSWDGNPYIGMGSWQIGCAYRVLSAFFLQKKEALGLGDLGLAPPWTVELSEQTWTYLKLVL